MIEKYYNLNDPSKKGPRGFLFAYNENGELLFTRENMIVESGRKKMMEYGFDTRDSKITKIILGNGSELTRPTDRFITDMGNSLVTINDRIKNNVITNPNGLDYYKGSEDFIDEIYNFSNFEKLTIDHKTGNITSPECGVFLYRISGKNNNGIDIQGYDNSCFDIVKDNNDLKAVVKIFVRKTNNDDEGNNSTNTSISTQKISELALFMGDEMFSRVVFPPYYKSSTQSIVFNYYIYF